MTCGEGQHTRRKTCSNPLPKYGGRSCDGKDVETEQCKKDPCRKSIIFFSTFDIFYFFDSCKMRRLNTNLQTYLVKGKTYRNQMDLI